MSKSPTCAAARRNAPLSTFCANGTQLARLPPPLFTCSSISIPLDSVPRKTSPPPLNVIASPSNAPAHDMLVDGEGTRCMNNTIHVAPPHSLPIIAAFVLHCMAPSPRLQGLQSTIPVKRTFNH
eukprot:762602-Hanusia_phi.AAC.1